MFKVNIPVNIPVNIYLFKVNNRNTRKMCDVCSKVIIKTPEPCTLLWCFFVKFEHILPIFLVPLLLTLQKGNINWERHWEEVPILDHCSISPPPEKLWLTDIFMGYINRRLTWNELSNDMLYLHCQHWKYFLTTHFLTTFSLLSIRVFNVNFEEVLFAQFNVKRISHNKFYHVSLFGLLKGGMLTRKWFICWRQLLILVWYHNNSHITSQFYP